MSYSVGPSPIAPGEVTHGWDLLPRVAESALVHICRPFTRAGEAALVAAKSLGKKIVLSDFEHSTSAVGASLQMTSLADCLVCRSEAEARPYSNHPWVAILDLTSRESWPAVGDIYSNLLGAGASSA